MKIITKEDINKVRTIEGFPIGSDDSILYISDAPNYLACPNPFIADFLRMYGSSYDEESDDYKRVALSADVSEDKNDVIYKVHSYHTKVPYKAIMRYILHYTNPGDIVLDGFCGTGMVGVAANNCSNPDPVFKQLIESEMPYVKWGRRFPILNDLSPIATLISKNYTSYVDINEFELEAKRILCEAEKECSWMFETKHISDESKELKKTGRINYIVWSDVLICPQCGKEIVFYNVAVDPKSGKVNKTFFCQSCGASLQKKDCENAFETVFDSALSKTHRRLKQLPVVVNYQYAGKKYVKAPDENDFAVLSKIECLDIPYWFPSQRMCIGTESRRNDKIGLTHVHHYFFKRILYVLAKIYNLIKEKKTKCTDILLIWFTSQIINISKMNRFRPQVSYPYNPLSGTLYVSSVISESNPLNAYARKIKTFVDALKSNKGNVSCISTGSATQLPIPSDSCDYIFTDPPFGSNLNYSELSFLWEAWIDVITGQNFEAIVNPATGKFLHEYQDIMTKCFKEYFRVLKPKRWITVEFHNSKNSVWNAILEAIQKSGFVVADVRTLDKQGYSFKQVNSSMAVKQDLIISAYKPSNVFLQSFVIKTGSTDSAWEFVRQHLSKLPVVVYSEKKGMLDIISERQGFLLFDRMISYHIIQGYKVPLDSVDFYRGLDERFLFRDGMYFLPDQVNEYDMARSKMDVDTIHYSAVSNEKSAIAWLYQFLDESTGYGRMTYAEIQPKFIQELKAVDKREKMSELIEILEENFLKDDCGKWYIPDLSKLGDIAKLREKNLLKEFQSYQESECKLKVFRSEAIRTGFSKLWKERDYKGIVSVAERLPVNSIQEDPNILMYYDVSLARIKNDNNL